jgi:hypothetical protein
MIGATLVSALPLAAVSAVSSPSPSISQAQHLANLQTRGTAEITRRLTALSSAQVAVTATTKLSVEDKAALTAQITAETASLTALKTKLAADTDLTTARTDVQSIVSDYRVYALMLPKARLAAALDHVMALESALQKLHDKLLTPVGAEDANPAAGVSADRAKLDEMAAQLAAAHAATDGLEAKLLALQPTDYNADHTVLTQYRQSLTAARSDLAAARNDAKAIIDALKAGKPKS